MPEFWLDADSFITPHRTAHRFSYGTTLWDFLEIRAREGVIGSPLIVFDQELSSNKRKEEKDKLELWAKELKGILFVPPDDSVQVEYGKVAAHVQNCGRYAQHNIVKFLDGADPWVIAYAMALGGRIVTFEGPEPRSKNPKIPDVAEQFGVECLQLWDMLNELTFKIG